LRRYRLAGTVTIGKDASLTDPHDLLKGLLAGEATESAQALVEMMIGAKVINPKTITGGQFLIAFLNQVLNQNANSFGTVLTVQPQPDLLSRARRESKHSSHISCVFYATWFEHTLNDVLYGLLRRAGMKLKSVRAILRKLDADSKLLLVTDMSGYSLAPEHRKGWDQVCSARNEFLHYKVLDLSEMRQSEERARDALLKIESLVRGLVDFDRHVLIGDFNFRAFSRRIFGSPEAVLDAIREVNEQLRSKKWPIRILLQQGDRELVLYNEDADASVKGPRQADQSLRVES
jgi:hypothetical protein